VAGEPTALDETLVDEPTAVSPLGAADRLRVAFVGQGVYFRQCALERPAAGVEPVFVDFRAAVAPEPMLARLRALEPDVVLVFRPEIVPPGLFGGLEALTIGYLTEPLPRIGGHGHRDLEERMRWLRQVDPSNFDRIVSFDPLIAQTASAVLPVWRSLPLPVADSVFHEVRPRANPPRLLFLGRSTEHRELMLEPLKRAPYPLVHIAHGLADGALMRFFDATDVQLNLHNNPYPTFENRVCLALAAGHLVISEPLSPDHELSARGDYLEARTPEELLGLVDNLTSQPDAYAEIQAAGRRQAERFRASRVYPELLREAVADVRERGGRDRPASAALR
jgi:hypothetical protein